MRKLLNYFFPRSVSGVIGSFQKVVDDLKKVAQHHSDLADDHEDNIADLLDEIDTLSDMQNHSLNEAEQAAELAHKLSVSFGVTK